MKIIKEAVKNFNKVQRTSISIRKTFCTIYQYPWANFKAEFKARFDVLSEISLYKNKVQVCAPGKIPGNYGFQTLPIIYEADTKDKEMDR